MNLIPIRVEDILHQYSAYHYPLIWEYINEDSSYGLTYYDSKFKWYECIFDVDEETKNKGRPFGIVCLTENRYLPLSLHISVFETLIKGHGFGSKIMNYLIKWAHDMKLKSITLQSRTERATNFYKKHGFRNRNIDGCPIMRKYV